ncbi:hypothetical protein A4X13_0g6492, partial [Tilletia indica]
MNTDNPDSFFSVTTSKLREVAMHNFTRPKGGIKKMDRPTVTNFLIASLIKEETSMFQAIARRQTDTDDKWMHQASPKIIRQLKERHDTSIIDAYLASSERVNHTHLPAPFRLDPNRMRLEDSPVDSDGEDGMQDQEPSRPPVPEELWPLPVSQETKDDCVRNFLDGTEIRIGPTCAVCARRSYTRDLLFRKSTVMCKRINVDSIDLEVLRIKDEHVLDRHIDDFTFGCDPIDGLALDRNGLHLSDEPVSLDICDDCFRCLTAKSPRLPPLALNNGNIRGKLPPDLADCTWLEERLCARFLASAYVVRLYDLCKPGAPEHRQRVMKGHTCAFPLHTISTATKLPRSLGDGDAFVSCVVIGPRKVRKEDLRHIFKVRREKVRALFHFLRANFKNYPQFPINETALDCLPADDVPELMMRYVVYNETGDVPSLFDQETTGLQPHPAMAFTDDDTSTAQTFLERHGMIDINGVSIPSHDRMRSAFASTVPDLVIRHGSEFVQEYKNPELFPGMFPTLFPWGIGGFEGKRDSALSMERQAQYLLDLSEPDFRRHWSFIFVVANIKQRRAIHHGSRFACKTADFPRISKALAGLTPSLVQNICEHLNQGGTMRTLSAEENRISDLLKRCELMSVHVPGSKAAMNRARADIRGYTGLFGVFHLFLTLNPSPLSSPVFQVFYGDSNVQLDVRMPELPPASTRAVRVADDPVAASDFFHFHIAAVMAHLFGWDFKKKESTEAGGILGHMEAFFLVKEHTMRGQLHGHAIIWLKNGLNPRPVREKLQADLEFRSRYLAFFDDLIQHQAPASSAPPNTLSKSAQLERPLHPDDPAYASTFLHDYGRLAEEVQRHRCTFTCFKGGRESCRFLFPHAIQLSPTFDTASNSVLPRIEDPTMNWHNPTLLVMTRHNHDLKSVQSGKSSAAAASYITSYATKSDETPANQVSMINTVFHRMAQYGQDTSDVKALLTRCVMQFGRERQLHAQQAATYVRDLSDTFTSHDGIPMLSGYLLCTVINRYGPLRDDTIAVDSGCRGDELRPAVIATASVSSTTAPQRLEDAVTAEDEEQEEQEEDTSVVPLYGDGRPHQVDDYLHRGDTLAHLSFYDFVRFCSLIPLPKRPNKNHHPLKDSHPSASTSCHRLTGKAVGVPRALAPSFARPDGTASHGDRYCAAMLAHFRPFGVDSPLKSAEQSYEDVFATTDFSQQARQIMVNWTALSECDDARDAELLRRRKQEAFRESGGGDEAGEMADVTLESGIDDPNADLTISGAQLAAPKPSRELEAYASALSTNQWFQTQGVQSDCPPTLPAQRFISRNKRKWSKEQSTLEASAKADKNAPQASYGILAEDLGILTQLVETVEFDPETFNNVAIPAIPTQVSQHEGRSPEALISQLVDERGLTKSQELAFTIAARHFFSQLLDDKITPLRLLMHGEAGTGKTVVVRLLREVLERFGKGAQMVLAAPTGKAAAAIGGNTIHSLFSLDVHQRKATAEEAGTQRDPLDGRRISYLQTTFHSTKWLFIDEISMVSCELLSDVDQALRVGTSALDTPFGGVNILLAGDLCQLPPVCAAPLYSINSSRTAPSATQTKVELGRAIWTTVTEVVEFTEQMRMQDAQMAECLRRMRTRKCTDSDVEFLNRRVLKSKANPLGVTLEQHRNAIALAYKNETVRILNHRKATGHAVGAGTSIPIACAIDKTTTPLNAEKRQRLLLYNGGGRTKVGLGKIPLSTGMPVVFRGGNLSVPLGVTNGALATVVSWDLVRDHLGFDIPRGVVLKFDEEAKWKLTDFEEGCLPISPISSTFNYKDETQS